MFCELVTWCLVFLEISHEPDNFLYSLTLLVHLKEDVTPTID